MLPRVNTIDSPLLGLSQRLPPSNVQAEQALLGALLANNRAYERVSEFLAPEHFADPSHLTRRPLMVSAAIFFNVTRVRRRSPERSIHYHHP